MSTKRFNPKKKDEAGKSNGRRASSAATAIRTYAGLRSVEPIEDYHLSDLVADIRHMCHRDGRDFDEILANAQRHYLEEK